MLTEQLPIIIGLVGIAAAVGERTIKTFFEKKQADPKLQFNITYLINALIGTGIAFTIITAIPTILAEITSQPSTAITIIAIIGNFIIGYLGTYRIIDGMNKSTAAKIELEELKE